MTKEVQAGPFTVLCDDPYEVWRAETFFEKEPGTIAWLDTIQPGDVVFDIGANIGLYTIYAAQRVGDKGTVIAFEPHLLNAWKLLQNVKHNGLQARVMVVTVPLSDRDGFDIFHYRSDRAASSGSQVGTTIGEDGRRFEPVLQAYTLRATLGRFIVEIGFQPDMLKIDVDGRELDILQGWPWLGGAVKSPRSIQVEVHPSDARQIATYLTCAGYREAGVHFTHNGQKQIGDGADPATVTRNTIYERAMVLA